MKRIISFAAAIFILSILSGCGTLSGAGIGYLVRGPQGAIAGALIGAAIDVVNPQPGRYAQQQVVYQPQPVPEARTEDSAWLAGYGAEKKRLMQVQGQIDARKELPEAALATPPQYQTGTIGGVQYAPGVVMSQSYAQAYIPPYGYVLGCTVRDHRHRHGQHCYHRDNHRR